MLKIENLYKVFYPNTINENKLFNNLSLEVKEEDFITILGSNGAGKSTLLNIIAGTVEVDKGKITLNHIDVTYKEEYIRSRRMGRVFQNPSLGVAPKMTVLENLSLADNKGKRYGLTKGINRKRISYYKEVLKKVDLGLEDKLNNKVELLSGGQRQGLTLVMAVISEPNILLLDEHTAALDPVASQKIIKITKDIVEERKISTLMVTHNLKQALECGNRLIMMRRGKIVLDIKDEERKKLDTTEKLLELFEKERLKEDLSDKNIIQ